jgi:hypothetical protein
LRRAALSLCCTTTLSQRAAALFTAVESLEGISDFGEPLAAMEGVATGPLPICRIPAPLGRASRKREKSADGEWESPRDHRLREAVGTQRRCRRSRAARARSGDRPSLRAWCTALMVRGQWAEALGACDAAATLVTAARWQENFLDLRRWLPSGQSGRRGGSARVRLACRALTGAALRWIGDGPPSPSLLKRPGRH